MTHLPLAILLSDMTFTLVYYAMAVLPDDCAGTVDMSIH